MAYVSGSCDFPKKENFDGSSEWFWDPSCALNFLKRKLDGWCEQVM